jgi:aspartyl protease family protein
MLFARLQEHAMTRPIIWALLVFGAAGATALSTLDHVVDQTGIGARSAVSGTVSGQPGGDRIMRLPADRRGHYIADLGVDGRMMRMLVDTGASFVALRDSDARAAGLHGNLTGNRYNLQTANGVVEARGVRIREMRLGSIIVRDVEAVILPDGQLGSNLLGMSFLNKLRGFEVSGQTLILRE